MKIVFTGDLQCEFENLDLVEIVVQQIREEKPDLLVLLGDLKERYNPVDVRVYNYVIGMIDQFANNDTRVLINLGNHDRVGMTNDRESWLPALEKAGAWVAYSPRVYETKANLYFLPYRSSVEEIRKGAKFLAKEAATNSFRKKILCFHQGLKEARYNEFLSAKDEPLSVEDLCPKKYDLVIGAHIHKRQKVKYNHVQYVGSPFATDWGEANDKKGFLVLEL